MTKYPPTPPLSEQDKFKLGLIGVVVIIIISGIITLLFADDFNNTYTKEDCIRQWHDVGVYANAEEYCTDYP